MSLIAPPYAVWQGMWKRGPASRLSDVGIYYMTQRNRDDDGHANSSAEADRPIHARLRAGRAALHGKRVVVAIMGGIAGWLIGLLATHLTGWRWWVRICVAIGPAIALLIAERRRIVRTAEEVNRPVRIFDDTDSDKFGHTGSREDKTAP